MLIKDLAVPSVTCLLNSVALVGKIDALQVESRPLPKTLVDYLSSQGIAIASKSVVTTVSRPQGSSDKLFQNSSGWSVFGNHFVDTYGSFSGAYSVKHSNGWQISYRLSGDPLRTDNSLVIVAARYEGGILFNALCTLLSIPFGRNMACTQQDPPTLAFFEEVWHPEIGAVAATNVLVPVISDPNRPLQYYVPIDRQGTVLSGVSLADPLSGKS